MRVVVDRRLHFYNYLKSFLGASYFWEDVDGSGLVNELLKASGLIKEEENPTAQEIFQRFKDRMSYRDGNRLTNAPRFGTLLFYGENPNAIEHVTVAMESGFMVATEDAVDSQAFISLRPLDYRGMPICSMHPPYPWG